MNYKKQKTSTKLREALFSPPMILCYGIYAVTFCTGFYLFFLSGVPFKDLLLDVYLSTEMGDVDLHYLLWVSLRNVALLLYVPYMVLLGLYVVMRKNYSLFIANIIGVLLSFFLVIFSYPLIMLVLMSLRRLTYYFFGF